MSLNEEERCRILQQLSDMFSGTSREHIRAVCEATDWNMNKCIDKFIGSEGGEETRDPQNPKCLQLQQGAIPKNSPQTNEMQNNSRNGPNESSPEGVVTKEYQNLGRQILSGFRVMVIMRGAPGSGKTYLAQSLVRQYVPLHAQYTMQDFVLSSDDYFYDSSGRYKFNGENVDKAHAYNHKRAREKAAAGWSPIIIDNTNIKLWEMMPYVVIAVQYGYLIELVEPNTPWRNSPGKLTLKNKHRVPRVTIERMLEKYEPANSNDLIKMLKETKYTVPLPQMRIHPPANLQHNIDAEERLQRFTTNDSSMTTVSSFTESNPQDNYATNESKEHGKNSNNWKTHEIEADRVWDLEKGSIAQTTETPKKIPDGNVLVGLLKEDVNKDDSQSIVNSTTSASFKTFERHGINCRNEHPSFVALRQIYPNKNVDSLWDLFVKCNGDIDWAVDILLKEDEFAKINGTDEFSQDLCIKLENNSEYVCSCDGKGDSEERLSTTPTASLLPTNGAKPLPQRHHSRFSRSNQRFNTAVQNMKENIENCFVLGEEQYSKHLLKIRNMRNSTTAGTSNSNKAFSDAETQTENCDAEEEEDESEEMLEVVLGEPLVQQLIQNFSTESTLSEQLPSKVPTNMNVFMPRSLAKQLYMLWVESAYNHIEEERQQMVRDDEDFARLLKNPKYEDCKQSPGNLHEILDMQLAWIIYNQQEGQTDETLSKSSVDLASYLTQIKLCETFPDIPRETLLAILSANGNRYNETVSVLRSTMDLDEDDGKSHVSMERQKEFLECARQENELFNERSQVRTQKNQEESVSEVGADYNISKLYVQPEERKRLALREFEETRNLAAHHCQLKAECYQKAKEAIQRGNSAVAVYYSQIANLHKKKIDLFNHRAANCIMDVHKYTQNNPDLLDLHYLHLIEALGCLDLFLDQHITGLRATSRTYKHLFIITGRGLHSTGGVSTIKNRVKARLKERNLRWSEVNPGLLKVKIFSASRYSKNIL